MTKILKEIFVWKFFDKNFPLPRHLFRLNVIIVKWCQQVMLTLFLSSSDIFRTISEVSTKVSSFSVKRFITLLITIHSFFYSYANFSVKRFHLRNNQNDSKKKFKKSFYCSSSHIYKRYICESTKAENERIFPYYILLPVNWL